MRCEQDDENNNNNETIRSLLLSFAHSLAASPPSPSLVCVSVCLSKIAI